MRSIIVPIPAPISTILKGFSGEVLGKDPDKTCQT
jgi:hypothetical protein